MPKLTDNRALRISGALAIALGLVGLGAAISGGEPKADRGEALEELNDAVAPRAAALDVSAYHAAIKEFRDEDPDAVDILSPIVQPGAEVTTGVSLDLGQRTTGEVEYLGPAADSFETISVTHTDRATATWVEIKARNTSANPAQLIGLVYVTTP